MRAYYSADNEHFLNESTDLVFANMAKNHGFDLNEQTKDSWIKEITILKDQLSPFIGGRIILEYTIPRMGKRVDSVFLYQGIIFLFEFKTGSHQKIRKQALDQVLDYALDLKYFHEQSNNRIIVPIAVFNEADEHLTCLSMYEDGIVYPIACNAHSIRSVIELVLSTYGELCKTPEIESREWENSSYMPTPTIIEAAQALYGNHSVKDITRNDAEDLNQTTTLVKSIIEKSKLCGKKSIIFLTGVPGAGKTLVGLNLACDLQNNSTDEHAVFLSGNHPLVTVLREALVNDKLARDLEKGKQTSKDTARREVGSFIQMIYHYRDYHFGNDIVPREKIAIFDEAQRAWTHEELASFVRKKTRAQHNREFERDISFSEPGFLISTMDRHKEWAVIICLVGGGQEINRGEAGMPEWFDSIRAHFSHWDVYTSMQMNDPDYLRGRSWEDLTKGINICAEKHLHLSTSMRSFRSERVSEFIKHLLDNEPEKARICLESIKDKYPIRITRDLNAAKNWIRSRSRGSERYGLFAASNGTRLRPSGVYYVRSNISPQNWFLGEKDDIRSSYYLEIVASEFETQGLEVDYAIVAWDADLRIENNEWKYYHISNRLTPPNWTKLKNTDSIVYLKNAYRVLLTRARQGFVIYIPEGNSYDATREKGYYDETYYYLKSIGIEEITE